jgi:hypothetical protein
MKRIIQLAVLLPVAAMATGCATPRLVDRSRDAADVLTATVGVGAGARVRVGPLHAGLILSGRSMGLRGGAFGDARGFQYDFEMLCFSHEAFDPVSEIDRGKSLVAGGNASPFLTTDLKPYSGQKKSADRAFYRAFGEVTEGDSRTRVEELLGKPSQVDIWPTPRPPVVTNTNGSITVYSHIGPPPWEKWRYARGGETFVIQFGPETWEGRDRWRVTRRTVGEDRTNR